MSSPRRGCLQWILPGTIHRSVPFSQWAHDDISIQQAVDFPAILCLGAGSRLGSALWEMLPWQGAAIASSMPLVKYPQLRAQGLCAALHGAGFEARAPQHSG